MSIETLLEAAKYIEYSSEVKARGEQPKDYSSYVSGAAGNRSYNLFFQPSTYALENERGRNTIEESRTDKRRTGGSGTREVHNKLEKNRRAHLKKCFETLKRQIPNMDEKKMSNLWILRSALRYIQSLKRRERECEYEVERLSREKSFLLRKCSNLKKELYLPLDQNDVADILPDDANDTNSTSTATECGPQSDIEDDKLCDDVNIKPSNTGSFSEAGLSVIKDDLHKNERVASLVTNLHEVTNLNNLKMENLANASNGSEFSTVKEKGTSYVKKAIVSEFVTNSSDSAAKVEPLSSNLRINRPAHVQVGSFAFPAQVVPHIGINGNNGILTHPTIQLVTPPSVRVITPSAMTARSLPVSAVANNISQGLQTCANSGTVQVVQSNPQTTVHMVKTPPSLARVLQQQPSSNASATFVKSLIASGGSTSCSPIAITQLTVKPNNSISNLVHQPIFTATTLKLQSVNAAASSSSSVTSAAGQIVTSNVKPGTQIAQVMTPNTMHVSSVGQVITAGPSLPTGAPLMSVLPSVNHTTVAQVIAPTQLGKVLSSPLIKSMGQIPIIQQQFLPHLGTVSGQPIVVMTTQPNSVPSSTTTAQQAEKFNFSV